MVTTTRLTEGFPLNVSEQIRISQRINPEISQRINPEANNCEGVEMYLELRIQTGYCSQVSTSTAWKRQKDLALWKNFTGGEKTGCNLVL